VPATTAINVEEIVRGLREGLPMRAQSPALARWEVIGTSNARAIGTPGR
jgi:hypothetical protein